MSQSDQDQIQDLQMRIAFLEQNLDELNEIVTNQQNQIGLLEGAVKHLNTVMEQMNGPGIKNPEDETPPPHY